jgi:hypothetical protein
MGVYIKIVKLLEKDGIGYYEVSTEDFGGAHFYIGINKSAQIINFYTSSDLNKPVKVVDCTRKNDPISTMDNVPMAIFGRVIIKVMRSFNLDIFPNYLSYEA